MHRVRSEPCQGRAGRHQPLRLRHCLALLAALQAAVVCAGEPAPADAAAVERGSEIFKLYCTECHGRDGRAQLDVISDATNLTMPAEYYNGTSDQDIYNSIANGAGVAMPAWRTALGSDEAVWDLVYFVKSLWAEQP